MARAEACGVLTSLPIASVEATIFALPVARYGGEVAALVEDRDLDRLHLAGVGRRRHQGEAELLARLQILGREDRRERIDDLGGLARLGADLGEQAHQGVAAADRERLGLGAGEQLVEIVVVVVGRHRRRPICGSRWCAARGARPSPSSG